MSNIVYSWTFDDTKNRSSLWYTIVLSIVIGLVIWWFLTSQYGLSFILLLMTGLVYFLENNSADEVRVDITDLWIQIGESFYDYSKISAVSYIYEAEKAVLLRLHMNKKWIRSIDLPIQNFSCRWH